MIPSDLDVSSILTYICLSTHSFYPLHKLDIASNLLLIYALHLIAPKLERKLHDLCDPSMITYHIWNYGNIPSPSMVQTKKDLAHRICKYSVNFFFKFWAWTNNEADAFLKQSIGTLLRRPRFHIWGNTSVLWQVKCEEIHLNPNILAAASPYHCIAYLPTLDRTCVPAYVPNHNIN